MFLGGLLQQLTTPEKKFDTSVFPGSNWFYYWRTSASLWENKLKDYQGAKPLFIPINWGLHSEVAGQFDFGQIKPECDLKRLEDTAIKLGIPIVFLVSLGPAPFITNCGLPSYLARHVSQNGDGLAISVIDDLEKMNRVYSFYDTNIFQHYRKFAYNLGQYITQMGLRSEIYGLECFRLEDGHNISFFKDHGPVFETGFNKYVKQLQDTDATKVESLIESKSFEKTLKQEFSELIRNLYLETTKEFLAGSWSGIIQTSMLGANTLDVFRKGFSGWDLEKKYFQTLTKAISDGFYPFTPLIKKGFENQSLGKSIEDLIDSTMVKSFLDNNFYSDDDSLNFKTLFFFEIYDGPSSVELSVERVLDRAGLNYYFKRSYPCNVKIQKQFKHDFEELDERTIHFFFGSKINATSFNYLIKLFMNGHKVFLDLTGLSGEFRNKLLAFYTENSLRNEKLNFISMVEKVSLGEGVIITYESESLINSSLIKRVEFWDSMISYLDVKHLDLDVDEDIFYFWRSRSSNTYELSYEEIRRVNFYNPTSYKKKARIKSSQNFAFIKKIYNKYVEVKSTPVGIDLIFQPGSNVTLDFGYYE